MFHSRPSRSELAVEWVMANRRWRTQPKRTDWLVPLVTAALGVGVLLAFANLQSDPIEAAVIQEGAESKPGGLIEAQVTWSYPWTPDQVEVETVKITQEEFDSGSVPIWVSTSSAGSDFTLTDPTYQPVLGDYILAIVIGGLLGVVMVMTMRGYGYVRGDGEPGSVPHVDVGEERGFYWRT